MYTANDVKAQVQLEFDDGFTTIVKEPFTFVSEPTIDTSQRDFEGIASGGTKLHVKGTFNTKCVNNSIVYVETHNRERYYNNCTVVNSNEMICNAPRVHSLSTTYWPTVVTQLGFQMDFFGQTLNRSVYGVVYRVFPDPIYNDFTVENVAITINGLFLYTGYSKDDLLVWTIQKPMAMCHVVFVGEKYIKCLASAPTDNLREILVVVGENLNQTVVKQQSKPLNDKPLANLTISTTVSIVFVITVLLFGTLFAFKTMLSNSRQHIESRFMEELRNITAGVDD